MHADRALRNLVHLAGLGSRVATRNHEVDRIHPAIPLAETFHDLPLVTVRKAPWRKSLREMEWFLSGDNKCPDELKDWWDGQLSSYILNPDRYLRGYSDQLSRFTSAREWYTAYTGFNQIKSLIEGIATYPNSRRHCLTAWHPEEMANIAHTNANPNTPATCHLSFVQFFVHGGSLFMKQYQRSCDILLGLPCNWVQHWALLTYIAYKTGYQVGGYTWLGGDAHVYAHESHQKVARAILDIPNSTLTGRGLTPSLVYTPTSEEFKASDFALSFEPQAPLVTGRPQLL